MIRFTFKALAVDTASEGTHFREAAHAEYFRHFTGIERTVQHRVMLDILKRLDLIQHNNDNHNKYGINDNDSKNQ